MVDRPTAPRLCGSSSSLAPDLDVAGVGVDDAAFVEAPRGQPGRDHERLDRRARLDDVGHRTIAIGLGLELVAIVRVVGGLVHHRQHFAGGDVEHDHRARLRALVANRRLQFAIREVLDAQVDGQHEIAPGPHRADFLDVLHDLAVAVLDHALGAVFAREPVIERELEALLAFIVDAGEADDVTRDFARRVVTAVLAHQVHARDLELADFLRLGGLHVARQIEKFPIEVRGHALRELVLVTLQRLRQPRQLIARERELFRIHPHRIDGRRYRERFSVAISNSAASRRDLGDAREARIALAGEKLVILELQLDRAIHEAQCATHQQREHEVRAPAKAAWIVTRSTRVAFAAPARFTAFSGPDFHGRGLHGDTSSMSLGGGMPILSLVPATFSTKACGRPGTLLELQLAPFDLQVVALDVEPLELHEQLARAMLRVDSPGRRRERRRPQQRDSQDQQLVGRRAHQRTFCVLFIRAPSVRRAARWSARADSPRARLLRRGSWSRCAGAAVARTRESPAGRRAPDRRSNAPG